MNFEGTKDGSVILATISDENGRRIKPITINMYKKLLAKKDKPAIAEMVYHRFYGRYIKPFMFDSKDYKENYKHGFAMMASACLLIEALESFYSGCEESESYGGQPFDSFFKKHSQFRAFANIKFYKNIRCGILHQAETTEGYRILRKGDLINLGEKAINAQKFMEQLEVVLKDYWQDLARSEWDSELWDNLRRKMRFIIRHCKA